jgi:LPS-assembly lipoprotein
MSSFNRRVFLMGSATAVLTTAGCGFEPVYGTDGVGNRLRDQILVDEPTTSDGFEITRQLEHRLGRSTQPKYGLSIALKTSEEGVALTLDNRTTRREVIGEVTYALRDLTSKAVLISGKVDSFTGYSTTGSTVAQVAAERDARRRLMIILADQISAELLAQAGKLPA